MVNEINGSRADVVWVGIGVPKQEKWMAQMRPRLDAPVLIGVGAAFDFHAGLVPQAPDLDSGVGAGVGLPAGPRAAAAGPALRPLQPPLRARASRASCRDHRRASERRPAATRVEPRPAAARGATARRRAAGDQR